MLEIPGGFCDIFHTSDYTVQTSLTDIMLWSEYNLAMGSDASLTHSEYNTSKLCKSKQGWMSDSQMSCF